MAGGDFRRSRRRERGAKDLVRRHFFLFFFFFFFVVACACTRPRRVKERYTLSKEKIYVVNARKKKTTRQARRGARQPSTEEYVCLGFSYCFGGRSWALFASFLLFFQKKETAAPSSSSRNTFASVLVLSNVATYIHSSHYGKFKLSSRFSRGGSDSRREARDGGTRSRSRTVSRARGGSRFGRQICFRFFFSAF